MNTSTKPFRRAGALVITYFYLLFMTAYIAGCTGVARLTGTVFVIDPIESPLLDRTRRILHARNTKKREKELKLATKIREERQHAAITAMSKEHTERKREDQKHHQKLIDFWDDMYEVARTKEIAELAEAKRLKAIAEKDEARKRREREQEMWRKAEVERIRKFKLEQAEREKAAAAERLRIDAEIQKEKKALELYYARAQSYGTSALTAAGGLAAPVNTRYDIEEPSYTERTVRVHSLHQREQATKASQITATYSENEKITVDGWTVGEELYGNRIWLHVKPNSTTLGGWVWGGGLNSWSTSGLGKMSDKLRMHYDNTENVVLRDMAGREVRRFSRFTSNSLSAFDKLEEMHANPEIHHAQARLAELRSQRDALEAPKPTDVSEFGTLTAGLIKSDKIAVGTYEPFPTMDSIREAMDTLGELSYTDLGLLQKKVKDKYKAISDYAGSKVTIDLVDVDLMNDLVNYNDEIVKEGDRRNAIAKDLSAARFYTDRAGHTGKEILQYYANRPY